ncbi:UNVERIFIED_CONTAM: hypothetical protein Slati_1016900 [Sesamum latifolium]|uniref:DUF659 domain-containing protein n=1 Tax=Sesamum latifolium TaxID=2727402 RepID=A0AAW2XRG3_9LAMI
MNNASNYIAAGYTIEQKYPHIVKTSCAAHCLDLILEDIDEVSLVKSTLENARKIVKFIYKYQQVLDLMRSHTDGRELKRPGERILGRAKEIVEVVEPLVKVLRMVDGDGSTISYLYAALNKAKEAIKAYYNNNIEKFMPYWKIINDRWDKNLYSDLYVAGAVLNPNLFYSKHVVVDKETKPALERIIQKMVPNADARKNLTSELLQYVGRKPNIFTEFAVNGLNDAHPTAHTKKRNRLEPKNLHNLVFVRMNLHMKKTSKNKELNDATPISLENINGFEEFDWFYYNEEEPNGNSSSTSSSSSGDSGQNQSEFHLTFD